MKNNNFLQLLAIGLTLAGFTPIANAADASIPPVPVSDDEIRERATSGIDHLIAHLSEDEKAKVKLEVTQKVDSTKLEDPAFANALGKLVTQSMNFGQIMGVTLCLNEMDLEKLRLPAFLQVLGELVTEPMSTAQRAAISYAFIHVEPAKLENSAFRRLLKRWVTDKSDHNQIVQIVPSLAKVDSVKLENAGYTNALERLIADERKMTPFQTGFIITHLALVDSAKLEHPAFADILEGLINNRMEPYLVGYHIMYLGLTFTPETH
jgi:hypothetical protein